MRRIWELDSEMILKLALDQGKCLADIADEMGVSRQYISKALKKKHCSEKNVMRIAGAIGRKPSEIVRWVN